MLIRSSVPAELGLSDWLQLVIHFSLCSQYSQCFDYRTKIDSNFASDITGNTLPPKPPPNPPANPLPLALDPEPAPPAPPAPPALPFWMIRIRPPLPEPPLPEAPLPALPAPLNPPNPPPKPLPNPPNSKRQNTVKYENFRENFIFAKSV